MHLNYKSDVKSGLFVEGVHIIQGTLCMGLQVLKGSSSSMVNLNSFQRVAQV